jgi:dTDP-4-dehydrorhamnose reductase
MSTQRALALLETETVTDRMSAMQATLDVGKANAVSALAQIDNLNSELAGAMAERFKLVATVHGEKRRYNQKTSFWEDKIKSAEAKTAKEETRVKHLEEVRRKLNTRIQVLEALRESEREALAAFDVNAGGVRRVAAAATAAGARLFHISTDYVFDGRASVPYAESDFPRPINIYGSSKLAGEWAVRAEGAELLGVRTLVSTDAEGRSSTAVHRCGWRATGRTVIRTMSISHRTG